MDPQVGHGISRAEEGAHDAVDAGTTRADSINSAVSQVLTQLIQQTGSNPPPATAANHVPQNAAAVQQVQPPSKFGIPAFEGGSAAKWLTQSQRIVS